MEATVGDVMTREVVTAGPETTLREIATLLVERGISGVPVVDGEGRVLGVVSETDLIDPEKRRVRLPRTALFGLFPLPERVVQEAFDEGETLTARDLMSRDVVLLPEDASVGEAVEEMVLRRVNRIPVTHKGMLVGILTRHDVLRALHTGPAPDRVAEPAGEVTDDTGGAGER